MVERMKNKEKDVKVIKVTKLDKSEVRRAFSLPPGQFVKSDKKRLMLMLMTALRLLLGC